MGRAKRFGACVISQRRMKGDDPEIDAAQTPKRFDRRLALLGKTRKTFTDSIPNKTTVEIRQIDVWWAKGQIKKALLPLPQRFMSVRSQ